jgi:hypothetical protein
MRIPQSRLGPSLDYRSISMLLSLAAAACSANGSIPIQPGLATGVVFENATIDAVAVYVDDGSDEWLLGHVEPGRTVHLRLPDYFANKLVDVTLVAVPLGARRDNAHGGELTGAVRSELESTEHLLTMYWTLKPGALVASVRPAGRKVAKGS